MLLEGMLTFEDDGEKTPWLTPPRQWGTVDLSGWCYAHQWDGAAGTASSHLLKWDGENIRFLTQPHWWPSQRMQALGCPSYCSSCLSVSLPCLASLEKVLRIWRAGSSSLAIIPSAWLCVWADDAPSHATAGALWEVQTLTFCNVFSLKKWEHNGSSEHFGFLLQKQELLEFPLWVLLGQGFTFQQQLDCVISRHMDGILSYRCFTSGLLHISPFLDWAQRNWTQNQGVIPRLGFSMHRQSSRLEKQA